MKIKAISKISALLLAVIILMLSLAGCKKDLPQETVRSYFSKLALGQFTEADALCSESVWSTEFFTIERNTSRIFIDNEANHKSISQGIILRSCGNSTINGDKAEVKVKVASYNLIEILQDYMSLLYISDSASVDQTAQEQLLSKMLNSAEFVEKEITVQLEFIDNEWVIKPDMELADAISGGLASHEVDYESDEEAAEAENKAEDSKEDKE